MQVVKGIILVGLGMLGWLTAPGGGAAIRRFQIPSVAAMVTPRLDPALSVAQRVASAVAFGVGLVLIGMEVAHAILGSLP